MNRLRPISNAGILTMLLTHTKALIKHDHHLSRPPADQNDLNLKLLPLRLMFKRQHPIGGRSNSLRMLKRITNLNNLLPITIRMTHNALCMCGIVSGNCPRSFSSYNSSSSNINNSRTRNRCRRMIWTLMWKGMLCLRG